MTETPDLVSLPGVTEEKHEVLEAVSGFLATEELDQPNAGKVIESLKGCTIAHFACHGYTDHSDPSNSGLVFQTCTNPPKQEVLTVHKISEVNSRNARIAYLSACSTAENRVAQLTDEVIHV
jgi:CHAT domain-containing protein